MARFDGTGPNGQGPMTGRGMGNCIKPVDNNNQGFFGRGFFGFGRGCGRGFRNQFFSRNKFNDVNSLNSRAEYLKKELELVNKEIDSLKDK